MARMSAGPRNIPAATAPPRRFGSIAEAAQLIDVSDKTVRRYIANGRLTGYRVGPRLLKVDLNELLALARPIPTAGDAA